MLTPVQKDQLGYTLTKRLSQAIRDNDIYVEEVDTASNMILTVVDTMNTQEEVVAFLQKLASAWPFLNELSLQHIFQEQQAVHAA